MLRPAFSMDDKSLLECRLKEIGFKTELGRDLLVTDQEEPPLVRNFREKGFDITYKCWEDNKSKKKIWKGTKDNLVFQVVTKTGKLPRYNLRRRNKSHKTTQTEAKDAFWSQGQ